MVRRGLGLPTNGVKQGCSLSPLLFSLYINGMGREITEGIEGAVTGDRVSCVSHMLYASRRWFILIGSLSHLCRICSRTMVWCFQKIQVQIFGHAAKKLKPRTSPRLHVALLIFRKRMTLSLGNNSGHICVVVLCHLLCSA